MTSTPTTAPPKPAPVTLLQNPLCAFRITSSNFCNAGLQLHASKKRGTGNDISTTSPCSPPIRRKPSCASPHVPSSPSFLRSAGLRTGLQMSQMSLSREARRKLSEEGTGASESLEKEWDYTYIMKWINCAWCVLSGH